MATSSTLSVTDDCGDDTEKSHTVTLLGALLQQDRLRWASRQSAEAVPELESLKLALVRAPVAWCFSKQPVSPDN